MSPADILYSVGLTVAGSIAIAYTTLWLQNRIRRRKLFNSLYYEIVANFSVAMHDLGIINFLEEHKSRGKSEGDWTYFDISLFHTSCYQTFQLGGEPLNLPHKIAMTLGETYELIFTHNRQIALLTLEFPPRARGISERLKTIMDKLNLLQAEMERTHFVNPKPPG